MDIKDFEGKVVRLTAERLAHIMEHPEMAPHSEKINETLAAPDVVVGSRSDTEARLYYRHFRGLSVGDKHLCVVVKCKEEDAFIITAYFTDGVKRGDVIWKR